ncbi:MAG TPA: MBL fold metallo-hydrolase [Rhodocyclaceae bacterium]|nr:MBL fold metallo-hydrolase [Rhodocyclaceae bacterium]HNB79805.1 MBL fold metallo-hydrolase [Rhodocyclaceae bacterium]
MLEARIIPVTSFQQNCSLVWDTETRLAAVVDPGGDLDRVLAAVEQAGVTLDRILVTHGHLDHAGAAADLAEKLSLRIEGPQREDDFWIKAMSVAARQWGFPPARPFVPTRWLEEGDTVVLGKLCFQVHHCPGHTPGHVVFFEPVSRVAFVGDVLFAGSIGRTDFPRGDHDALIRSIREKLFPLGDDVRFVPGHGPMSTFGNERRTNPYVADPA